MIGNSSCVQHTAEGIFCAHYLLLPKVRHLIVQLYIVCRIYSFQLVFSGIHTR